MRIGNLRIGDLCLLNAGPNLNVFKKLKSEERFLKKSGFINCFSGDFDRVRCFCGDFDLGDLDRVRCFGGDFDLGDLDRVRCFT